MYIIIINHFFGKLEFILSFPVLKSVFFAVPVSVVCERYTV